MSEEGVDNSGFLARWSRRKQQNEPTDTGISAPGAAVGDSDPDGSPVIQDESQSSAHQGAVVDRLESEATIPVLTDADMPAVESLDSDSDYSPFLSEGVSKELRNMALKKLFFSGKFALRDGLDDYDDDFTKFEPLGDTITSDMKFHQRRKERERLARLEEEERQRLREVAPEEERPEEELAEEEAGADVEAIDKQEQNPRREDLDESDMPNDDNKLSKPALMADADHLTDAEKISAGGGKLQRKLPPNNVMPEGKIT